jgi:hypothetical protein
LFAKAKKTIPGLIVFIMILAAGLFLARPRIIYGNPTGEIPFSMPDEIGGYKAVKILFCLNDQCAYAFRETDLMTTVDGEKKVADECPKCGALLSPVSIGEEKLLPNNTPIFRREYTKQGRPPILVTIVFSGIERRSIHRPQICLVSQGNRILNEYSRNFNIDKKKKLQLRILEIHQIFGSGDDQETVVLPAIYTYWLFNPERETDSHWKRFLYMAIDNSFRNYRPRWGYVSISIPRNQTNPDAWNRQLDEFLPFLYPFISELREKLDEQRNITTVIDSSSAELNINQGEVEVKTQNPSSKDANRKEL